MGFFILFFLKPDFRQILVKLINFKGNELIWLDRKLNWPPNNIFRHGSKPKSLQTHRNLFENTQNHPPKKSPKAKKRQLFRKLILCRKTLSSKVDLIWQLRPIRKVENARTLILFLSWFLQKLDFHHQNIAFYLKCLISTPVFSWNSTFSFGAIWDLFLEEHIAFCDGFDIILKYDPKTTF